MLVKIEISFIHNHLSEVLPYTPVSAVGYNLNLTFTKEEFEKTLVAKVIKPSNIDIYSTNSQTFSAVKDGAIRSFDVRTSDNAVEIKCNFHYGAPLDGINNIPVFENIIKELKYFLGYELTL